MLQAHLNDKNETLERYKERLTNFSGEFEIGLFVFIAKKSLLWVCLFFAIAIGGSWLYLRYTQPEYESNAVMQINNDNNAKMLNVTGLYDMEDQNELASAIEIIRSKVFLRRVLNKLPLEVSYFAQGNIKTNEHYKSSPYIVGLNIKNEAILGTRFDIVFNSLLNGGEISFDYGGQKFQKTFSENQWLEFPQVSFLITFDKEKLRSMLKTTGKNTYFFTLNSIDALADSYFNRLNVALINEPAKTILISFTDNNPEKAYDVVNTITSEYISYDIERRSESGKKALAFIEQQLASVTTQMELSEDSLQSFRIKNNIRDNEDVNTFNMTRFGSIEDQLVRVQLDDRVMSEIESKLLEKDVDVKSLLALVSGTDNEQALSTPINNLYRLISEREEARMTVTDGSPEIKSWDYQIEVQKGLLINSVNSILAQDKIREKALGDKMKEYSSKLPVADNSNIEYTSLQHLYDINEKFRSLLIEKKTEYSISEAGFTPKHVLLEKARIPALPFSPSKRSALVTSILLAFVLSLIVIIVRYLMHDTITSLNQISKHTQASISVLGIIPRYKHIVPVSQLLVDKNPKALIAEAFRSLRTNLQFISNEEGPKVMAVTSTVSGEGKTFVAINLGGIIAYSGKKVIIVDLDMRKPKIHLGFGVENIKGMSTMLIGKDKTEDCIQHSSLDNLDFITAGPIPPNPSELIISKKMAVIIEQLKKSYDLVIIDNPPVGLVTDGIHTIQMADYPVYIFRADYSKRNFIQIVDRLYNENGIKKLAVILNGVDVDRKSYGYNYGYGYGYGYGNGYGYYDEHSKKKSRFSRLLGRK